MLLSFTYVTDATGLAEVMEALTDAEIIGLDTETSGLDPLTDILRLAQLATPDHVYVIDCLTVPIAPLAPLFDGTRELVGHNLAFDLRFFAGAGIEVGEARLFDTMLAAQLLDADAGQPKPRGHFGLAAVATRTIGETVDKTEQASAWCAETLTDEQLTYAAQDAAVVLRIAVAQRTALETAALTEVATLEFQTLPAVVAMEQAGAPFDRAAWQALAERASDDRRRLEGDLSAVAPVEELARFAPAPKTKKQRESPPPFNWNSSQQVLALLQSRGHRIKNVAETTLATIADREPVAAVLIAYRDARKRENTYGSGWADTNVHPRTGRIHPHFRQLGAASGRMACSQPNLQNIPRGQAYRACFKPPPGRVLVKADYSQIELRITAQLTQDPAMLAAYRAVEDLHVTTAAAVLGIGPGAVTKEHRQLAKALNFGLIYGMGADRLQDYAREQYGITLSDREARDFRSSFFQLYAGVRRWHRRQADGAVDTRTLSGRRRRGVTSFTEKLNTPVQGTGADLLKAALIRLHRDRRFPSASIVNVIHDEVLVECDAADAGAVGAWLTGHMEAAGAVVLPDVPLVADSAAMLDWSGAPV